jgi:putative transposase
MATVIGIASRRVVGYAMADHLRTELVSDAPASALAARDPAPGVIFHADRGCQYTSAAFASLAGDCEVTLPHGRTGQCWDNALPGSFFASLQGELTDLQARPTRAMAQRPVAEYIAWYTGTRPHSTLGYRSPAEFEEDTNIKRQPDQVISPVRQSGATPWWNPREGRGLLPGHARGHRTGHARGLFHGHGH